MSTTMSEIRDLLNGYREHLESDHVCEYIGLFGDEIVEHRQRLDRAIAAIDAQELNAAPPFLVVSENRFAREYRFSSNPADTIDAVEKRVANFPRTHRIIPFAAKYDCYLEQPEK